MSGGAATSESESVLLLSSLIRFGAINETYFCVRGPHGAVFPCLGFSCLRWRHSNAVSEPKNYGAPTTIFLSGPAMPTTKGNDFLAVIDADPSSASYGHLVTTLATDQQTMRVHHTEYTMPASGMLFANDHDAGRTFIFDVRDPLHPKTVTSFTDMAGYMHPHSYVRLPNGNVLATFQHAHHGEADGRVVCPAAWWRLTTRAK